MPVVLMTTNEGWCWWIILPNNQLELQQNMIWSEEDSRIIRKWSELVGRGKIAPIQSYFLKEGTSNLGTAFLNIHLTIFRNGRTISNIRLTITVILLLSEIMPTDLCLNKNARVSNILVLILIVPESVHSPSRFSFPSHAFISTFSFSFSNFLWS